MSISSLYSTWNLIKILTAPPQSLSVAAATTSWRPPEWSKLLIKTSLTDTDKTWYFDGIIKEEHNSQLRITEHPVQTGANITDHAYMMPAQVVLEVGMSDAMDSVISGQWPTLDKTITAYQKLLYWQQNRVVMTLTTNLNTYNNMVIAQISVPRDAKSAYSMKANVTFRQIMVGVVATTTVSARPQTTDTTSGGASQAQTVDRGSLLHQAAVAAGVE